jgi:hypothetical protein
MFITNLNAKLNKELSWFQAFAVFWMICVVFWVVPRRVVFNSWRLGTLCLLHGTDSVPKRRLLNTTRRGTIQKINTQQKELSVDKTPYTRDEGCVWSWNSATSWLCRNPVYFINSMAYDRWGYQKGLCSRVKGSEMHKHKHKPTKWQRRQRHSFIRGRNFLVLFFCHPSKFHADFKALILWCNWFHNE